MKAQVSYSDRPLSVCLLNMYISNFISRTSGPILTEVGTNHPLAKGIENCTNEGQPPSHGEINIHKIFLKSSPKPAGQFKSKLVQIILR
jgi:hypothetical protein